MPIEPCNHAYEEESPAHPGITHTKPLTPFPAEETMPSKETTRKEAKVLIQPTQEATTDALAPHDLTIT